MEKLFKLKEKHTTVKTEIIAGITTFLAMAYILGVNPIILADAGMDIPSVFMATAISAAFASIVMGLIAILLPWQPVWESMLYFHIRFAELWDSAGPLHYVLYLFQVLSL